MKRISCFWGIVAFSFAFILVSCSSKNEIVWQLGKADNSAGEFALAPSGYKDFLKNDFGWEDKDFIIGTADAVTGWQGS